MLNPLVAYHGLVAHCVYKAFASNVVARSVLDLVV